VTGGQFATIKERVELPELLAFYGFYPARNGKYICPFHEEKTPSFSIKGQSWYCFGCGCGGDVIDFLVKLYNLSPIEAARQLDSDFQLEVFQSEPPSAVQRQQVAAAARQRQRDKALVEYFDAWCAGMLKIVTRELWVLDAVVDLYAPRNVGDVPADEFANALQALPGVEYAFDVLIFGNLENKIALYKHFCREGVDHESVR
jgi:hypothetical protein